MSDLFGTTGPTPPAPTVTAGVTPTVTPTGAPTTPPTATYDRARYETTSADRPQAHSGPALGSIRVEEPRRHPLTYAALALSVLALLLAIIALSRPAGNDVNRVRVGNNDCVSVAQDTGPAALYCRTGALPTG
ncbi:MAG: hypothetical protein NVSMB55_03350 [Mycobacteriales bacterium]